MNAQQMLDYIIKPSLKHMAGNYDSLNARMLLLATAAIESNCGYYIKQVKGPAEGPWQMEPDTEIDILANCDALKDKYFLTKVLSMSNSVIPNKLTLNPAYACAMARLKYAMDPKPLPSHDNKKEIYDVYKRVYNTHLGSSTWDKFRHAWDINNLSKVKLNG